VLAAASGGWVYLTDILADREATSHAEYQAAWRAVRRLQDRQAAAVHAYVLGGPKLLIGPAGAQPPVLRPEPRSR
jgi:hypothetical protein